MNILKLINSHYTYSKNKYLANNQTKPNNNTNRYGNTSPKTSHRSTHASGYFRISNSTHASGFTIIELLIVIVIIGILVAITSVAYTGLTKQAKETSIKSDLKQAHTQLELDKTKNGTYPNNSDNLKTSQGNTFSYTVESDGSEFCLMASNPNLDTKYTITQDGTITQGSCPFKPGGFIQTANQDNCPTTRTMAVDKRDNHTYYIQKINYNDGDSSCWMTTNLAYAGGGDNTHGDTITLSTGGSNTFTEAKYYAHPDNAKPTTNPTPPSTATDGGVNTATRQYGYLYNWCAAMGNQQGTGACQNNTTSYDPKKSICPAGWRLPTGEATTGEFTKLNNTVNGGLTNTDAGLRTEWLGQRSGIWNGSFASQGGYGCYWSSTQNSAANARYLTFTSTYVSPSSNYNKSNGFAVRCVAE